MPFFNTWKFRVAYLLFTASEGIAAGLAAKLPVVLTVGFCVVVGAVKLTLEALRP